MALTNASSIQAILGVAIGIYDPCEGYRLKARDWELLFCKHEDLLHREF